MNKNGFALFVIFAAVWVMGCTWFAWRGGYAAGQRDAAAQTNAILLKLPETGGIIRIPPGTWKILSVKEDVGGAILIRVEPEAR